jgi:glycosyltransferase involved in cell wall biosynthesis
VPDEATSEGAETGDGATADRDARPLVSVVVPTYDRPDRLRRALESVAAQTYPEVELLVVDDCSPTPLEPVVAGVDLTGLAGVTYLRNEENLGGSATRNRGIRAAIGEYVAFLDDDDEWKPTKLARQVETFAESDPEVGLVYVGTELRRGGRPVNTVVHSLSGWVTEELLRGASISEYSGAMVRAAVVDTVGYPDERYPSWQDREWFVRLSVHCAFAACEEPLVVRHLDGDDRVTRNYLVKRDVTYPLFVETFRPLAAAYGPDAVRAFDAAMAGKMGRTAVQHGHYADARRFLLRSLRLDPTDLEGYLFLLTALGGRLTYAPARRGRQLLHRVVGQ